MKPKHRYIWLVDTIRRAGEISHNDLSNHWESNTALSDNKPLKRPTFRRWRKDIQVQFGITIGCRKSGNFSYYIENQNGFDNCPYLGDLSMECLSRINKSSITDENEIRQDLHDCLFYLEKHLKQNKDYDTEWPEYLSIRVLPYYISRHLTDAEIGYTVNLLMEWFRIGYKPVVECVVHLALSDLSTDVATRLLGLCDKELVRIICDHNDDKAFIMLKNYLNKVAVRKLYFRKANEGNVKYMFYIVEYLYQKRRYEKAFYYLNKLEKYGREHVATYLGLMYFYGRGVARNFDKAKEYLEMNIHDATAEEIYALGEIYIRQTFALGKAVELYQNFIIQPYENRKDPFYLKIMKRFNGIRSTFGIPDWIIMTVVIGKNNRRCEFSVELPAFCRILLCWGEPQSMIYIYNSGKERRLMTFRHTYRRPGEYKIDFEVTCIHAIEALEFSRYRKQLKDIKFLTGRGLKKISIIGQNIETLSLPPSEYLTGLVCRNNNIKSLDLSQCRRLTHLDCSSNPIAELKLHKNAPLARVCVRNTMLNRKLLADKLHFNRGTFCNALDYDSLESLDMRLEYYFRCTTWDKTKKFLRTKLSHYYCHALTKCEYAFRKLKEMSQKNNRTPYSKGVLEMWNDYVSDDTIVGHEEFFLEKEPWSVSLATKVRDMYFKEPWMRCESTPPEYYVACCLVNMIRNDKEMKSAMTYQKM